MQHQTILTQYARWLQHKDYSAATIQKYLYALARFFAESRAAAVPQKEAVAAWRDSLQARGYCYQPACAGHQRDQSLAGFGR